MCVCLGATLWSVTDELRPAQLATLRQLDARLKYELKVTARSAATDEDVTSLTKLISFGPEPGKHHVEIVLQTFAKMPI